MANTTVSPTSPTPAGQQQYDPIKMLRDYLSATSDAPPHFGNYLINRLGDQITWYDKKSGDFKRKWEKFRRWVIILSASIPFLVGLIGMDLFAQEAVDKYVDLVIKIVVGAAGVAIAILEGLNSLYKSQEHYVDYRMTAEKLKQEFSYFMGRSGAYTGLSAESAYAQLVAQAEGIMANENNRWSEVTRQNDKAAMADDIQNAVQEYLKKYGIQPAPSGQKAPPAPPLPEPQPEVQPEPPVQPETLPAPDVLPEEEGIDPADRNPEGVN